MWPLVTTISTHKLHTQSSCRFAYWDCWALTISELLNFPLTPTVAICVQLWRPDPVKPSFVIFDIRALWRSAWASECPDVKNYKWLFSRSGTGCFIHVCGNSGRQRVLKLLSEVVGDSAGCSSNTSVSVRWHHCSHGHRRRRQHSTFGCCQVRHPATWQQVSCSWRNRV